MLPTLNELKKLHDYERFQTLFYYISEGAAVQYSPKFREFGIPVNDGGSSVITLKFCPWTGIKLPESLRNEWFDRLEAAGAVPKDGVLVSRGKIPSEFDDDRWWRDTELAYVE